MPITSEKVKETTWVNIDTDTLLENYQKFTASGKQIAPVVKANAYGHGAVGVAQALLKTGTVPFLIVATYDGAQGLRAAGITAPILVIGYVPAEVVAENLEPDITFTAVDLEHLDALEAALEKTQPVHLKINTGMNRYGADPAKLPEICSHLQSARHVVLTGVFSHFADAFVGINDFTHQQISCFNEISRELSERFPLCQTTHLASTSSHRLRDQIDANTERVGIGLYGLANYTDEFQTKPVLSLMSQVASLQEIPSGAAVGYGRTYVAEGKRLIATIPAGYFEGVDRRLSNRGVVRLGENVCPIVGKVSMNATTIDVSNCRPRPRVRDLVELISADADAPNSAAAIARKIDAVNYRITTQIPAALVRLFTKP